LVEAKLLGAAAAIHVDAIAALLCSTETQILVAVLEAIELLPETVVAPYITAVVRLLDGDASVHAAAHATASRHCRAIAVLLQKPDTRLLALESLVQLGPAATPYVHMIGRHLTDPNTIVKWRVVQVLANTGLAAAPHSHPVQMLLRDRDKAVRLGALEVLQQIAEAADTVAVAAMLRDPVWNIRRAALFALDQLNAVRKHGMAVVDCLKDEDLKVRKAAVQVIAKLGNDIAPHLGELSRRVEDPSLEVRATAIELLEQFHWWRNRK